MCSPSSNGHGAPGEIDANLDRLKDRGPTSVWNLFGSSRGNTPSGKNQTSRRP